MGLSDPMATPFFMKAPSTGASQSGSQSPGAVGHYANQGSNANPQPGPKPRARIRQAPSTKPGSTRGRKPTRTAG